MRDLGFSVSYRSANCLSWKYTKQQNKDTNQREPRTKLFFCGGSDEVRLECLNNGVFKFFFGGVLLVRPCC